MLDYILDMWHQLNVCYRARLEFLASLVCSQELLTARGLYGRLESESADLGDFWAATEEIYKLIGVKERKFGNFTDEATYTQLEQSQELVKLRNEIIKQIEQFRKKQKKTKDVESLQIMWKGINYADVCKIEKDQLEAKYTEDVRREMLEKIKRRQQAQSRVGAGVITTM